jgi:hypothetical protein
MGMGWGMAKLTGECYTAKNAAIDFGAGALGMGAFKNARNLYGAVKSYRRTQAMFGTAVRAPGQAARQLSGYAGDAVNQGAQAVAKGAAGVGLKSFKDKCKEDDDPCK